MLPEKLRAHASLARQLIRACGGLIEAAANCPLEKSRLQEFTDATKGALMPIEVIDALQEHCGRAIYTDGWSAMLPGRGGLTSAEDEACSLTEKVVAIQAEVRLARGHLSEHQKRDVELLIQAAEDRLRCLRSAAERGGAA